MLPKYNTFALFKFPTFLTSIALTRARNCLSRNQLIVHTFFLIGEVNPSSREVIRILRNPILPARVDDMQILGNLMTICDKLINDTELLRKSEILDILILTSN